MIDEGRHTKVSFSSVFLHTGSFAQNFFQTDLIKRCTCKSLSEALILASTNPQYDNRLFIELQIQYLHENYKHKSRLEHVAYKNCSECQKHFLYTTFSPQI